jgi:hypothetical protein
VARRAEDLDMRSLIALTAFFVVVSGGLLLTLEGPKFIPAMGELLPGLQDDTDKVLVFLVGGVEGVDQVREAVDPGRIVWSTPEAVALKEGRIVAAGQHAVGEPIKQAGWMDRDIEIFTVSKRDILPTRGDGGLQDGNGEEVDPERLARLRELVNKPTLTYGEQLFVLQAMNDGVPF